MNLIFMSAAFHAVNDSRYLAYGTGGRGGAVDPTKFGQIQHLFRQKTTHLFDQLRHRTEQVSMYLRYVLGDVTKETFIGYNCTTVKE